ncbi:MAG: division/cell wall cluster transcriptional repressor MraZ [Treponema sp.]|jgi:MraZ protein|nr:division/cell wall cluster transcriptional repressor MraZ [Treponema sp.]
MDTLTGKYKGTLDDKSRISLPAFFRRVLNEPTLYLTQGMDKCLWLYPSDEWHSMRNVIMNNTDPFSSRFRDLRRRIIAPCHPVEIDKAGRIPVAQSLREFAGISKDCLFLGQVEYIEIWDEETFEAYQASGGEENTAAASEELSETLRRNRGVGK